MLSWLFVSFFSAIMTAIRCFKVALVWALGSSAATAEVLISQYYEGSSFNKWIELTNTGEEAVSLDGYVLTRWANAATEDWRIEGSTTSNRDTLDGLSIPAGGFLLLGNTGAALPTYAAVDVATNNTPNFNGDDSVVLYDTTLGAVGSLAGIVDALSFTDSGNEGKDRSFYRLNNDRGYDAVTSGSTVLDFPAVWAEKTNAEVGEAAESDPWYLRGFSRSAWISIVRIESKYSLNFCWSEYPSERFRECASSRTRSVMFRNASTSRVPKRRR